MVKNLSAMQETGIDLWFGKVPWKRKWHPTPVLLPGKSHGHRSLVGYHPWGHKESDTTERTSLLLCIILFACIGTKTLRKDNLRN